MASAENFVLRSTVTSPFGRKVRMAIDALGLTGRVTLTTGRSARRKRHAAPAEPARQNAVPGAGRRQHDLRQRHHHRIPARRRGHRPPAAAARTCPLQGPDAGAARRRHHGCVHPGRLREPLPSRPRRPRRAGSTISAARSCAGWRHSKPRRRIRTKPTSSRSVCPARSAISTGASRSTGARPSLALSTWLDRFSAHEPAFERTRAKDS